MTRIAIEYRKQSKWRNWESYVEQLPISQSDLILDLGCGTGDVAVLLANKCSKVFAIDFNKDIIEFAKMENQPPNIQYICNDLKRLHEIELPLVDGIWSSFTAAYFPDFTPILKSWINLLKPNGWIAMVEVNDLFAHEPIDIDIKEKFKSYYKRQKANNVYDFEMGENLRVFLIKENIKIEFQKNKLDRELVFDGAANKEIITAWEYRLDRMLALQDFFEKERFEIAKGQFLKALQNDNHKCETKINFIIGRKLHTHNNV